jgi:uncharacterized protein (TIGR03086 family)
VRDLVNHVVGEDLWTGPLVEGATIEEVGDRLDGDVLGDEPVARAKEAADRALAAVAQRLPSGGTVQLSYGEEQLDEYLYQLAADHLVHAWDLAAATGADRALDPELVDAVAGWFAHREADLPVGRCRRSPSARGRAGCPVAADRGLRPRPGLVLGRRLDVLGQDVGDTPFG